MKMSRQLLSMFLFFFYEDVKAAIKYVSFFFFFLGGWGGVLCDLVYSLLLAFVWGLS